jgi:serine/threonine protein phosphatase PrpC
MILVCSDGLYGVLPEPSIQEALWSTASIEECTQFLERKTLQLGGPDNLAIVLLKYTDERPEV